MAHIFAFVSPRPGQWLLASLLISGCPSPYPQGSNTDATSTSSTGGPTSDPTGNPTTNPTSGSINTSSVDPTEGSTTSSGSTTMPVSTGSSTGDLTTGSTGSTDGSSTGPIDLQKQANWGNACMSDEDCEPLVGEKGVCLHDVLGLYELPGGYCTKGCLLPDNMTFYVPDDPNCGQGIHCIGASGYFEVCAIECTDNSECPREGYECRTLPQIAMPGDPKFCLMTDEYML